MSEFLVDTCIWSEALRRKSPDPVICEQLAKMLRNLQAVLIGPVRMCRNLKVFFGDFMRVPLLSGFIVFRSFLRVFRIIVVKC